MVSAGKTSKKPETPTVLNGFVVFSLPNHLKQLVFQVFNGFERKKKKKTGWEGQAGGPWRAPFPICSETFKNLKNQLF